MKNTAEIKTTGKVLFALANILFCCSVFAQGSYVEITIQNTSSSVLNYVEFMSSIRPPDLRGSKLITLVGSTNAINPRESQKMYFSPTPINSYFLAKAEIEYQIADGPSVCTVRIGVNFDEQGRSSGHVRATSGASASQQGQDSIEPGNQSRGYYEEPCKTIAVDAAWPLITISDK